ncbi:hypothetical protein Asch01_03053 [Acinetobacter schindleri]
MTRIAFQDLYAEPYTHCYGCGRDNPHGHQLKSYWDVPFVQTIVKLLYYSYRIRKKLEITHRLSRSTILYAYV